MTKSDDVDADLHPAPPDAGGQAAGDDLRTRLTRRGVMRAGNGLLLSSCTSFAASGACASAEAATAGEAGAPDDAVIRLCRRFDMLEAEKAAIYNRGGATSLADEAAREALAEPLWAAQTKLAMRIHRMRCGTLAGATARARTIALCFPDLLLPALATGTDAKLIAALVRDLAALPDGRGDGALLPFAGTGPMRRPA